MTVEKKQNETRELVLGIFSATVSLAVVVGAIGLGSFAIWKAVDLIF
ncbi:MAG: hypothetical protein K5639_06850 [Eubacterium sp.]|nr:hypothetical protein [Eubacterium sp.]